jgi:F-type H+-transporting ATPase subunit delta
MKVNTKAYAIALYETIKENKGEHLKTALANFVVLLAKKNLLSSANKILADFSRYYNEAEGIAEVSAATAKALTADEIEKISKQLKAAIGQDVELKNTVSPELIGGIKLKIGDTLIDGSLKNQIAELKQKLIA